MQWKQEKYGGIQSIRVPPSQIWTPDVCSAGDDEEEELSLGSLTVSSLQVVLFNNADGRYEASFKSHVVIYYDGAMNWIPPAIYKSSCFINVKFFPFGSLFLRRFDRRRSNGFRRSTSV